MAGFLDRLRRAASGTQSNAARGAMAGASFGPIGALVGGVGGYFLDRTASNRAADFSANVGQPQIASVNDRLAEGIWGPSYSSGSAPILGSAPGLPDAALSDSLGITNWGSATAPDAEAGDSRGHGGGNAGAGWSGVIGPGANGHALIRGTTQFGASGAGGASRFYKRGGSSAK